MNAPALPRSPWTEAAEPAPATPPLEGDHSTDVAIVGGGFTGLSTALHLAERGIDATVLEAVEPGFGASGRNGGQVIPGLKYDPEQIVARFGPERGEAIAGFVGRATDIALGIAERHAIACDARRGGWLQPMHSPVARREIERRVRQWADRGAPVELLDAAETERRSGARGYLGAFFDGRGATVNPLGLARGLARAALAAGAQVHGQTRVTSLERRDGRWHLATPGGTVSADRVLLATNAYTDDLWPGLKQSVIPVWSYQVATRPLGGNLREKILPGGVAISDTRRVLSYCRQDAKGRLLVGGRGHFRESTDPADFSNVRRALARLFPEAAGLELDYCWSGRVALTLDHWPSFGELAPGLTAALGYNGRGVALATASGQVLAEHFAGAPLESLPLPVRPIRPLPFHGLRGPGLAVAVHTMRLRDWWETRVAGAGR